MLEADIERECVLDGTLNCAFERLGEGISEFDRELGALEIGDIIGIHSAGSVTLLYIGGRVFLVLLAEDKVRRCMDGRCVARGSMEVSCDLIFGSSVGPCCRRTGDRFGVELIVITDSGEVSTVQYDDVDKFRL